MSHSYTRKVLINGNGDYQVWRGHKYLKLGGSIKVFTGPASTSDGINSDAVVDEINNADEVDISDYTVRELFLFDNQLKMKAK